MGDEFKMTSCETCIPSVGENLQTILTSTGWVSQGHLAESGERGILAFIASVQPGFMRREISTWEDVWNRRVCWRTVDEEVLEAIGPPKSDGETWRDRPPLL